MLWRREVLNFLGLRCLKLYCPIVLQRNEAHLASSLVVPLPERSRCCHNNSCLNFFVGHLDRCVAGSVAYDILESCCEETSNPTAAIREYRHKFRLQTSLSAVRQQFPLEFTAPSIVKKVKKRISHMQSQVASSQRGSSPQLGWRFSHSCIFIVFYITWKFILIGNNRKFIRLKSASITLPPSRPDFLILLASLMLISYVTALP